jgi:hypothetical protein
MASIHRQVEQDLAVAVVTAEKDGELYAMKLEKDGELYAMKLAEKDAEILRSRGTVTTRGIVEYYLKDAKEEMLLKGTFNACIVCKELEKFDLDDPAIALTTRRLKKLTSECAFKDTDLYDMYKVLSDEIHGGPWSGPALRLHSKNMLPKYRDFIRGLAESTYFQVDETE